MGIKHLQKLLSFTGVAYLGEIQDIHVWSLPPSGRLLAVYDGTPFEAIRASLDSLRETGCIVLPLEDSSSFIADLIASLNMEEHERLAEALLERI